MNYIFIIFGCLLGIIIGILIKKKRYDGLFIIDDSDDEITKWVIDIKYNPEILYNKKEIRLKVKKMSNSNID